VSENVARASFEVPGDLEFQERQWRIEPWIWFGILVLIVAALAGLFGSGALSARSLENGALHLDYDFFLRYNTPTELRVRLKADQHHNAAFWLDQGFLDEIDLESVNPQPRDVKVRGLQTHFEFAAFDDVEVQLQFRPNRAGLLAGAIGSEVPATRLEFSQFVYP
jgi:hypothetical protein